MKVLQDCTLLQACEYLAFGWEPLDDIEDKLVAKRNRDEQQDYLSEISKAKKLLIHLFKDYGLKCRDSKNHEIKLPAIVQEQGMDSYNIHILCGLINDANFYSEKAPRGSIGIFIKDRKNSDNDLFLPDVKIVFSDLQYVKTNLDTKTREPKIWLTLTLEPDGFYVRINKICKLRIKKYDSESKLDNLLKIAIENSPNKLTKEDIQNQWPTSIKQKVDDDAERLYNIITTSSLPKHVVRAFFPILTSEEIKCQCTINDLDLERIGITEMVLQSDSRQPKSKVQ